MNYSEPLTEAQQAILDCLQSGASTRRELQEKLSGYAHSTIDANLRILSAKSLIKSEEKVETRNKFNEKHTVQVKVYSAC